MLPLLILIAALPSFAPLGGATAGRQDAPEDKAAAALLEKSAKGAATAKVLHAQSRCIPEGGGGGDEIVDIDVKLMEPDLLWITLSMAKETLLEIRSDGRRVVTKVEGSKVVLDVPPKDLVTMARRCAGYSMIALGLLMEQLERGDGGKVSRLPEFSIAEVKADGKEKIGAVEAAIVAFKIKSDSKQAPELAVRAWLDPATGRPLKRVLSMGPMAITENVTLLSTDEVMTEEDFAFHGAKTLKIGRELQLRRSVEAFQRITGRAPRSVAELKRRPDWLDADVFWPDGGFWLGDAVPADLPFAVEGDCVKIGAAVLPAPDGRFVPAPSERLRQLFSARVRVDLLAAAIEAWRETYRMLPERQVDLCKRPDWARAWPEGGFVGPEIPKDPWGQPYRVVTETDSVTVLVRSDKSRRIRVAALTAEEKAALAAGDTPKLSAAEREKIAALIRQLGEDDPAAREEAARTLWRLGSRIAKVIEERLKVEKDAQVAGELGGILKKFPPARLSAWRRELASLRVRVEAAEKIVPEDGFVVDERTALVGLRTLCTGEADFRSNDRDGNLTNDYWVADLAALHGLAPAGNPQTAACAIKLIDPAMAAADATPARGSYPGLAAVEDDPPPHAGYLYRALRKDEFGTPYDNGSHRNLAKYGFACYPAEYGDGATRTFIVNEDATLWAKDLGGAIVEDFPANPATEGWTKVE